MYKKDLEESWVYQKILGEGREEGREALRETFMGFLMLGIRCSSI